MCITKEGLNIIMVKKRKFIGKLILIIVIILIVFLGIVDNVRENRVEKFNEEIAEYDEKLNKYAFGTYYDSYMKLIDKTKEINRKKEDSQLDELVQEYKVILNNVETNGKTEISNYYNELKSLDLSKVGDENKNEINEIINQISVLIEKQYYRISYNEINILKVKINKYIEENNKVIQKQEEEKIEEEKKKVEMQEQENINNVYDNSINNNENSNEIINSEEENEVQNEYEAEEEEASFYSKDDNNVEDFE